LSRDSDLPLWSKAIPEKLAVTHLISRPRTHLALLYFIIQLMNQKQEEIGADL
jgi:hypothetical protein